MEINLIKPQSEEAEAELLKMVAVTGTEAGLDPYATGTPEYWLIHTEKGVAGYTGIHSVDFASRRCRGFLWIKPEFRKSGIGSAALIKRNTFLFNGMNMNRIEWVIPMDNEARIKMAEKLGQKQEGVLREVVYYEGKYHDYALYATLRSDFDKNGGG